MSWKITAFSFVVVVLDEIRAIKMTPNKIKKTSKNINILITGIKCLI